VGLHRPLRRDIYVIGKHLYEASEHYCPTPGCDYGEITVHFEPLTQTGPVTGLIRAPGTYTPAAAREKRQGRPQRAVSLQIGAQI